MGTSCCRPSTEKRVRVDKEATEDAAGDTPIVGVQEKEGCCKFFSCCMQSKEVEPAAPEEEEDKSFITAVAIVRHGERLDQVNPQAWFHSPMGRQFPFDCPLTRRGREMARQVAEELQKTGLTFGIVVSSPYLRCVQTAGEMAEVLGLKLCIDAELSEIYGPRTHGQWKTPPPRRGLADLSELVTLNGVPLLKSPLLVKSDNGDFFGSSPVWPESLETARLRLVSRVEQYLARGLQMKKNFVLVTHGDCVAASLGLLLASQGQSDPRQVVTRIDYCAYTIAERTVEEEDPVPLGLADETAGWRLRHGNCQVSDIGEGAAWKGPYDPVPLPEEAVRVREYEENEEPQKEQRKKLLKKSSTTMLKSALYRQKSRQLLEEMEQFDLQFEDLVGEGGDGGQEITNTEDLERLVDEHGGRRR